MAACTNCQTEVPQGTAFCPNCGVAVVGAPAYGSSSQIKFDAAKLSQTEWITGVATLILLISYFLGWYSVDGISVGNALDAHGYLYLPLIISIAVVAMLAVKALGRWTIPSSSPVNEAQVLLGATSITFVLTLIAFLFKPSGLGIVKVGWSFGAFIGLIAAIVALAPLARPIIEARRGR